MPQNQIHKIILFDGVCNLCNNTINFIIRHDMKSIFKFATLQSEVADELLKNFPPVKNKLDSIILLEKGVKYTQSSAALRIAKNLSGGYPILYVFIIIPKFFRDWIYSIVAKNRYKWFGKKEECMIPTPELRERFL